MSPLRYPLRDSLRDPVEEAALARVWNRIDARLRPQRGRHWRVPALALAGAVCACAAAVILYARRDAGPLRFAGGEAVAAVEAPAAGATVALSDGSSITLAGGARFEPLESSGTTFVGVLEKGSASFDVRPGGPRRWRIECGLATVEVVGTRFSCERDPGRLRVAVQRGAVLVSGERIENRARRLSAGESLLVEEAVSPSSASVPSSTSTGTPPGTSPPTITITPSIMITPPSTGAPPADRAHHAAAHHPTVAELLWLADRARLSGRPADAEAPLERILAEYAADPQAPLAAFALARLELDSLGQPAKGAAALSRALALGIPHGLREDVRGRLVEAYARAGDLAAARAAAKAYAHEFPRGRYAKAIESRLAPPAPADR